MEIKDYIDSTYLKTALQAGLTESENLDIVKALIDEAITEQFKLVIVRPEIVPLAKAMITKANAKTRVGTVIDFPAGRNTTAEKLSEAAYAIAEGADELDFVLNYIAFKEGKMAEVREQVFVCTKLGLENDKVVKWIIEIAALNEQQIIQLSALVKNVVLSNFDENTYQRVFVKSSTGFYTTEDGRPNGATPEAIKLMLQNSFPLPIKAAGGVRTYEDAALMLALGVKRIGTSSAGAICKGGSMDTEAY